MPKPVQKLREAPLGRVHTTAPLNRLQTFTVSGFRDLRGFAFGAMVAPQIIFVQRLQVLVDGNN